MTSIERPQPEQSVDADGYTWTVPHLPSIGDEPPYDLSGATNWERQEITSAWRAACREAEAMHRCAHVWLTDLLAPTRTDHVGDDHITGSGGALPIDAGVRLAEALHRLHHVHNGFRHRVAIASRASDPSAPVEAIRHLLDAFVESGVVEESDGPHLDAMHAWLGNVETSTGDTAGEVDQ